ncbi:phosphate signaling complex protein PhoU [candidate division KSB1 bacterium]|nr:phosphate signaling complex protein PhoU [candidate division KSB1 bacterium]
MQRHFHDELQILRETILKMAAAVEASIAKAIDALTERDNKLADEVLVADDHINELEILIEEQCLRLLALQQPMAIDLRFLTSALKINNDLERMGDHAVNISEIAKILNEQEQLKPLIDIPHMAEIAQSMLKDSLDSFVNGDVEKARGVCIRDDDVDHLNDQLFRELLTYMMEDASNISRALDLILISRNLERIADLSTNIAEEVIFIYNARTIKHHLFEKNWEDIRTRL